MKRLLILSLLAVVWKLRGDTVVFNPSTSTNVTNYVVYYGANKVSLGLSTNWVVTNVGPASVTPIFATAWANGIESLPSNTLLYTNRNFAPTTLRMVESPMLLQASNDLKAWRTLAVISSGDPPLLIHPDIFSFYRVRTQTTGIR